MFRTPHLPTDIFNCQSPANSTRKKQQHADTAVAQNISSPIGLVDNFRYIFTTADLQTVFYFHVEFLQQINELINVDQKHEWTDATTLHNISRSISNGPGSLIIFVWTLNLMCAIGRLKKFFYCFYCFLKLLPYHSLHTNSVANSLGRDSRVIIETLTEIDVNNTMLFYRQYCHNLIINRQSLSLISSLNILEEYDLWK